MISVLSSHINRWCTVVVRGSPRAFTYTGVLLSVGSDGWLVFESKDRSLKSVCVDDVLEVTSQKLRKEVGGGSR